ncbi:DUF1715-domain-containing protein [Xylariaceae sp. FL1651]|nr:DUF1715-domain-containing protein [Xylariaceae sp. FL1651]
MSSDDLFDDILNLEEQYYQEGYEQGQKDGAEAGRIEGYSVGLKKGFEKFVEAGRLQSKAMIWANRIPKYQQKQQDVTPQKQSADGLPIAEGEKPQDQIGAEKMEAEKSHTETVKASDESGKIATAPSKTRLPPINSNPRLEKNIEMLYGLVEPGTLSTDNDDESVNDFDSRMKGAQGKLRMIERAIGEGMSGRNVTSPSSPPRKNGNIEDVGGIRPQNKAMDTDG